MTVTTATSVSTPTSPLSHEEESLWPTMSYEEKFDLLFKKATEENNAWAQNKLGYYYLKGKGCNKSLKNSYAWHKLAADQGDASAQNNVAYCYQKGRGCQKNPEHSIHYYKLAAAQNHLRGIDGLGLCYLFGRGCAVDYDNAVQFFRHAANEKLASAQAHLGLCYEKGLGVKKSIRMAEDLYGAASDQGNKWAEKKGDDLIYVDDSDTDSLGFLDEDSREL